jgi:hypothetical protein
MVPFIAMISGPQVRLSIKVRPYVKCCRIMTWAERSCGRKATSHAPRTLPSARGQSHVQPASPAVEDVPFANSVRELIFLLGHVNLGCHRRRQ